jgi:hypothetical protein
MRTPSAKRCWGVDVRTAARRRGASSLRRVPRSDAGKWFFSTTCAANAQAFLEKAVDKVAEAYVNTIYVNETTRSSKN